MCYHDSELMNEYLCIKRIYATVGVSFPRKKIADVFHTLNVCAL